MLEARLARCIQHNLLTKPIEMNWTSNMSREFLELYEKYPVLWFPGHKERKNRHSMAQAWLEIQQQFGVDVPVDILRRKKESIMATYRSLRRKMRSAKAEGRTFRTNWFLYPLVNRIMRQARRNNIGIEDSVENGDEEEEEDGGEWSTLDKDVKPLKLQGTVLEVDGIEEGDEISNQSLELQFLNGKFGKINSKRSATPRKRNKPKVIIESDNTNSESYLLPELFRQSNADETFVPSDARTRMESHDSCSMYCQLLAEKLRSLSSRNRIIVQNKIDNLIFGALMEEMGVPTRQQKSASSSKDSDVEDNHQVDCDPHTLGIKSNSAVDMGEPIDSNITPETTDCDQSESMCEY